MALKLLSQMNFSVKLAWQASCSCRCLDKVRGVSSWVPADSTIDVEKLFINPRVQQLLRSLSGLSYSKMFRRVPRSRTERTLYRLASQEDLEKMEKEALIRAKRQMQIPPFLKPKTDPPEIVSSDPELAGLDTANFIFTDINYGISDSKRTVVVRQPDGDLREATAEEKSRMIRFYFQKHRRTTFNYEAFDEPHITENLQNKRHRHLLDLACLQLEPFDLEFIRVCRRIFDDVHEKALFQELWSTRHFPTLVFYLSLNKKIDALLLDFAKENRVKEMCWIVEMFCMCHPESATAELFFHSLNRNDPLEMLQIYAERDSKTRESLSLALERIKEELDTSLSAVNIEPI